MSKPKVKTEISPKGIFVYPSLNRPDTKFDADGVYSVKLKLPEAEAAELVTKIDDAISAQVKKTAAEFAAEGKKGKVKRADAPYTVDEEGGTVTINFKMKASGKRKDGTTFTQKPGLKSSKADPDTKQPMNIPEDTIIGGGSIGKVAFTVSPFYTATVGAGVTLRLKAVQVYKLVEPSYSYGFDAEEGAEDVEDEDGEGFTGGDETGDTDTDVDGADF